MSLRAGLVALPLLATALASSATPGDAALRLGHPDQAAELYRTGAGQGDADAALKLGLLLFRGKVSAERFGHAGQWFIRACDLGDNVGCHNAGVGYEYGAEEKSGLDKDLGKAREHYLKAAARGYMQSQYNLGSMYANKYFADDLEGLKWLLLAQRAAQACAREPLCDWILKDPPGHIAHLRERMPKEAQDQAAAQAAEWTPSK